MFFLLVTGWHKRPRGLQYAFQPRFAGRGSEMQLGGFRCPTQSVTKSVTASYEAVINDALIALIALANSAFFTRLGTSGRIISVVFCANIGV
jgi:hypothetical protein